MRAKFGKASASFYSLTTLRFSLKLSDRTKEVCLSDCSYESRGRMSANLLNPRGRVSRL